MENNAERIKTLRLREVPEGPTLRQVYWPVEMHQLSIEMEDDLRYLNPFEKLVMDFIEADGGLLSEASLAAELCVPSDFLSSIVRRLRDKNLLDGDGKLVKRKEGEKKRPVTGFAFRELVTGRFLPFVTIAREKTLAFEYPKTDGSSFRLTARTEALSITISDVAVAFRQMGKRTQGKLYLPDIRNVRVTDLHEPVAIRCSLKFEGRSGEVRILNPFTDKANQFESTLEAAFDETVAHDPAFGEWVLNWRRSVKTGNERPRKRERELFETAENLRRYPQLIAALRRCAGRSFESVYAAIEWALFYAHRQYAQGDSESLHRALGDAVTVGALQFVANELKIPSGLMENINDLSVRRHYDGEPEMITALAMVGEAAKLNPNHPFNRLVEEKFVRRVLDLKRLRDGSAHGGILSFSTLAEGWKERSGERCRRFVLTQGCEAACTAHLLRVQGKQLVRLIYRWVEKGHEVPPRLLDLANLLSGYFVTLPKAYEEAAYIDGASYTRTMVKVIFPMAKPSIVTVILFNFLSFWNEYIIAMTLLTDPKGPKTLPVGLMNLMKAQNAAAQYGQMYAGLVLVMLPTLILYICVQKKLTQGMTLGGLKG